MTPVRIIGIGSPRGPDRAGWTAVEALQQAGFEQRFPHGTVSLSLCAGPHELPRLVQGCRLVVLIDALQAPGNGIRLLDATGLKNRDDRLSVHGMDPQQMIKLMQTLADAPLRVVWAGIQAEACTSAAATRRAVERFVPELTAIVLARQSCRRAG